MSEETRTALSSANANLANLNRDIERLEAAAQRSEQAALEATAQLDKYLGLDKEITRWRVEQVKEGASTKVLPDHLKTQVDARRDGVEELDQSRATQQAIADELAELRRLQGPVEQTRQQCAVAILHEMGDALASELASLNHRRAELFQLLWGLDRLEVTGNGNEWSRVGLTEYARNAMNAHDSEVFPDGVEATREIAERWRRRLEAISANPYAEINPPKPVAPADYITEPGLGTWVPENGG